MRLKSSSTIRRGAGCAGARVGQQGQQAGEGQTRRAMAALYAQSGALE